MGEIQRHTLIYLPHEKSSQFTVKSLSCTKVTLNGTSTDTADDDDFEMAV